MARLMVWLKPLLPRLRLMTFTGFCRSRVKLDRVVDAFGHAKKVPTPVASSTLTGMIEQPKASPASPSALFVASAMVEATWVPWNSSSLAWASPLTKS